MLAIVSGVEPATTCPEPFTVREGTSALVVSMPHAGTGLPAEVADRLRPDARALPDTDWEIPALYDFVGNGSGEGPLAAASVIEAHCSRYLIDLNRDPAGASLYPGRATTELVPTTRFDGTPIWTDGAEPDASEIEARRIRWFEPYHAALAGLIDRTVERHGFAVLWDCHSILSRVPRLFDGVLPDLNLGTNDGASCDPVVQAAASAAMSAQARFTTVTNGRFRGGWITRRYGRPDRHVHALQMEIALSAYMDETPPWTLDDTRAAPLRATLQTIMTAAVDAAAELHGGRLR